MTIHNLIFLQLLNILSLLLAIRLANKRYAPARLPVVPEEYKPGIHEPPFAVVGNDQAAILFLSPGSFILEYLLISRIRILRVVKLRS